jgi:hypothetical protein
MLPIDLLATMRFRFEIFGALCITQISGLWLTFIVDETKSQSNKGANEIFIIGVLHGVGFGCMPGHNLIGNIHVENGGTFVIVQVANRLTLHCNTEMGFCIVWIALRISIQLKLTLLGLRQYSFNIVWKWLSFHLWSRYQLTSEAQCHKLNVGDPVFQNW